MSKKKDDGHRNGKCCGYEVLSDGRIVVAPLYKDAMDKLSIEENSVREVINSTTKSCQLLFEGIGRRKRELWERMGGDYGFDFDKNNYSLASGIITITPSEDKK